MACRYIPNPSSCRPTYLVIFKGDDTNFPGNQRIDLVIDTELDLTGIKAHFRFMDFVQDFNEIPADKSLQIVIPNEKTSAFPLGSADASLTFEDASGKIRTVSNRIHVVVTNSVQEAYNNQDTQSITVTVTGTVTWDMIQGKPNASDSNPLMDGEPSAGESSDYSRGDHRHPSDTSKRGLEDLDVRGNPTGEGSWFSVNGDTYTYSGGAWTREGSPFDAIVPGESTGAYVITGGGGDVGFSLDADYSATVPYLGTTYSIIGYVDTIAKVSEIPTRTSQLTNDSGYITSAEVHGDYIEDAAGNRINADRTIEEKDADAPWALSFSSGLHSTLEKKDSNHWQYEQHESSKYDLFYYTQEGSWDFIEYSWNGSEWEFVTEYSAVNESAIGNPDATYLQLGEDPAYGTATRQLMKSGNLALESAVANKKDKQDPVTDPTASGNATSFIDSISQDANGVITPTKKTIPTAAPSTSGEGGTAGLMSAADKEKLEGIAPGATAVTVDTSLSDSSTNPVQNKAVTAALAQKASLSDLPYALVTIGEWVTSDPYYAVVEADEPEAGAWWSLIETEGETPVGNASGNADSTSLTFVFGPDDTIVTATRSFTLLDRAGNRVEVSGDTTLTLPAAVPGYLRDFLVRLEISGSTVPTITFAAPTGETITYETDGDEFPVPDEAGDWLYSFTESCAAHKFAVSLKKVNEVAAPQAQGGS